MIKSIQLFIATAILFTFDSSFAQTNMPSKTQMIEVEGGEFTMGCGTNDSPCDKDERPSHQVKLKSFMIGKYEVSTYEWKQFAAAQKTKLPESTWEAKDNLPITNITWEDAIQFCNWLSSKENLTPAYIKKGNQYECNFDANGYRLPTEAEWEFAARGGNNSLGYKYSGANKMDNISWNKSNSNGTPHPYGTKLPNELGIFDMTGNVWEWCWDWYNEDYYKMKTHVNPKGPINGLKKIVRGGSWDSVSSYARVSNRISSTTGTTYPFYGMRLARSK